MDTVKRPNIMVFTSVNPVRNDVEYLTLVGAVVVKLLSNGRINTTNVTHAELHDASKFKFKELRYYA